MPRGLAYWLGAAAIALPLVGATAENQDDSQHAVGDLAAYMIGDYATAPGNLDETIIDRRIAVRFEGEAGLWFYGQLNTGDTQKLYRQRFHQLTLAADGRSVIQRSFAPIDSAKFDAPWQRPHVLDDLSTADIKPVLGKGCEQRWTKDARGTWRGSVDPKTCAVFSERRQTIIRIGADGFYKGAVHGTSERGFDKDMSPVWGSKPGEYITLKRCQSYLCTYEARVLLQRSKP